MHAGRRPEITDRHLGPASSRKGRWATPKRRGQMSIEEAGEPRAASDAGPRVVTFADIVFQKDRWHGPTTEQGGQVYKTTTDSPSAVVISTTRGTVEEYTYAAGGRAIRIYGNVVHVPYRDIEAAPVDWGKAYE
jgi:hypothetical protein